MISNEEEVFKITGFTPLLDTLTRRYGLIGAAVFGVVLRHSRMRNGICSASQERMALLLGINRMTVNRWISTLCTDGYLEDTTPEAKNRAHVYRVTGKAGIRQEIVAFDDGATQSSSDDFGATLNSTTATLSSSTDTLSSTTATLNSTTATQSSTSRQSRKQRRDKVGDEVGEAAAAAGASLLEEQIAGYINWAKANGKEVDRQRVEAAVKDWLLHVQEKGKNWRLNNYKAINERYELRELEEQKSRRDYLVPDYEDDDNQDQDDITEVDVPERIIRQFESISAGWPIGYRIGMKPISETDEAIVIGVGNALRVDVVESHYGKSLQNAFMKPIIFCEA